MEAYMIKKLMLVGWVVMMLAVMLPVASVSAAPLKDVPNPGSGKNAYPHVEKAFHRVKNWYDKQGLFLIKTREFISKAEIFIAKAEENGLDASSLKTLLDSFADGIPAVQAAHDRAGAIISAHNGFDGNEKVTDITAAAQTVKGAAAALQEGRQAHLGKGKALAEALRAFWQANKPHRINMGTNSLTPVPNEP
jgi:hypothetical protein